MLEGQWGEQMAEDVERDAGVRRSETRQLQSGYPLALAAEGERLVIAAMHGGRQLRRQLMDMGLRPGARISVLRAGGRGPVLVLAGETRLGIGRGMAEKIEVVPAAAGRS